MQVSSATAGITPPTAIAPPAAERTEKRENDGDDAKAGATSSRPQSINLNGQVTGQLIHQTA